MHGAAGGLPLIAYTMPAMAGSQWPLDVLRELAAEGVVSGVKESGEEVGRFLQILDTLPARVRGLLRHADAALPGHAGRRARAASSRSRTSRPERCVAVYEAAAAGEGGRAAELFAPLVPLLGAIRAAGPSPTGMRAAAADPLRHRHRDAAAARARAPTTRASARRSPARRVERSSR